MMILVLGGSASGKSEYAENVAAALGEGGKKLYLATMRPFGREAGRRIERHRRMRKGKGFESADRYTDVGGFPAEDCQVVLLECMSNLLANEMYREGADWEGLAEKLTEDVRLLEGRTEHIVVVSNDVASDGIDYGEETNRYISLMGEINRGLSARADCVIEVVCGIPIFHKGAPRIIWREKAC